MFDYPVVFVDIETTGGSYRNSRVLEVAAIRVENGLVTEEFSTLINPETYIPSTITNLTGINSGDVKDAPVFADIADKLSEVMDGAVFIAHNVRFDYSFLKAEFANIGMNFSPKLLCTVRLSRALYVGVKGHSLTKLIERHDIPVSDRHRALEDARAILYFTEKALDEHGYELFNQAVAKQIKSQSLPPHLDANEVNQVENVPGVYIFRNEVNAPIYVGKSIELKKRIVSHFQSTTMKELKISQQVHHVETIKTGSELAALIMESRLIKELQPLYNRMLRRVTKYSILIKTETDGYATLLSKSGNVGDAIDLADVYGVFRNRMMAKKKIDDITRTFFLCPKLMGLEKSNGACFSYSLGRCKGACIGEESPELYNRRFELGLMNSKIENWEYGGAVTVPINENGERVVIDNWIIQGFENSEGEMIMNDVEPSFDVDEYKIIRRFLKLNKNYIQLHHSL